MTTSHADHGHPNTSSARAACRKALAAGTPLAEAATKSDQPLYCIEGCSRPHQHRPLPTRSTAKKAKKAKAAAEEIIDDTKAARIAKGNAARLRACQAKAASLQGKRGECGECGKPAAWIDKSTTEPVCMAHVDYDNCILIPLS